MKLMLLFPPSWTLATGGPHLALPLLAGFLRTKGTDLEVCDLNWEIADHFGVAIDSSVARRACEPPTIERMNAPYFRAEDRLNETAKKYGGVWNAQVGFE